MIQFWNEHFQIKLKYYALNKELKDDLKDTTEPTECIIEKCRSHFLRTTRSSNSNIYKPKKIHLLISQKTNGIIWE